MFETMSIYSLVLMLSAALLFPPAFRHLLGAPRAVLLKTSWNLWAVTLPFAALCWYFAALWAQASRPLEVSLAAVIILLVLLSLVFAFLPVKPHAGLGQHSLTLVILVAYAIVSWIIKSLFAATTGATFDTQALMFGYFLLCPAFTAALLPRPRPIATGLFILLTALLLYAAGIGATSALWGIIPIPPASMQPGIVIMVSLLMPAVLAWMVWQVHDMPRARRVAAYLLAIGKFIVAFVALVGLTVLTVVLDYGRSIFAAARWIISELVPTIGVVVARGTVVLFQILWRGIRSIPALFWNITVGIGNGLVNAVIWFVSVPILGIGRGVIAIGDGLWRGSRGIFRGLVRATVWFATFALPSLMHGLVTLTGVLAAAAARVVKLSIRGLGHGFLLFGRTFVRLLVSSPRALWRTAVWLMTDVLPGIGKGLLAILLAMLHGISVVARGIWHGLGALILGFARGIYAFAGGLLRLLQTVAREYVALAPDVWDAYAWLLTDVMPNTGRAIWHGLLALGRVLIRAAVWLWKVALPSMGRGFIAAAHAIWDVLVAEVRGWARVLIWLIAVAPPLVARKMLAAARTGLSWLIGLVRGSGRALIWLVAIASVIAARKMVAAARTGVTWLVRVARAFGRALVWTVTILLPGTPKATLILLRGTAGIVRGSAHNLRVGFISIIVVPLLRMGQTLCNILGLVLRSLMRVPVPVFLTSAAALVIVLTAAIAWPSIESMIWPSPPPSLRIVGGSNLKSLEPILQRWGLENQVTVQVTYRGSLDIQSSLEDGSIQYDAIWQGDSLWTTMGGKSGLLKDSQSIMCSPVVLGVKKPVASRLGWTDNKQVRLQEILDTAESAKLRMFMASPAKSNSGALAYLGFLNSFDFNPNKATRLLRRIERTSDSSGWVRDSCRDQYGRCDAMINYESLILEMNQEMVTRGQEPMYIVYPAEGLGLADFPLSFVKTGGAEKESLFLQLESYLRSDAVQNEIAALGNRVGEGCGRVNKTIFKPEWGADLTRTTESVPHPEKSVINTALINYQGIFRKPSFTIYLLDFSTSMQGSRRSYLQTAMSMVLDQRQAAKYKLQGTSDDATIVIPFAGRILTDEDIRGWTVSGSDPEQFNSLLKKIQSQPTADMTNIYTPVAKALYLMREEDIANYMPSIILLTDGESNRGSIEEVKQALQETGLYNVPIFGITFGDASQQQLNELAGLTGGRVFDGTKDLVEAFRQAKGQN